MTNGGQNRPAVRSKVKARKALRARMYAFLVKCTMHKRYATTPAGHKLFK